MSRTLLDLSRHVKEICEPYFTQLGLDHFNYIHRNNNGSITYLCSNPHWLEHYLQKEYPKIGAFEQNETLSDYKFLLWNGLDKDDSILTDSREIIGVEHGIALVQKENDGFGFYNLGTKSSNPSIINKYINSIPQYEKFILAFQEKARTLMREAKKIKFGNHSSPIITRESKLGYQTGNPHLTARELQCIDYLSLGKTAEEIAIILNISKRTVESHVQNIKQKLNCYNQFRLGYLLGRMRIKTSHY